MQSIVCSGWYIVLHHMIIKFFCRIDIYVICTFHMFYNCMLCCYCAIYAFKVLLLHQKSNLKKQPHIVLPTFQFWTCSCSHNNLAYRCIMSSLNFTCKKRDIFVFYSTGQDICGSGMWYPTHWSPTVTELLRLKLKECFK